MASGLFGLPFGLFGQAYGLFRSLDSGLFGTIGEVMLPYLGGTMAFHAHPFDKTSVFPVGDEVLVIYFEPPQTVFVDELPDVLRHTRR